MTFQSLASSPLAGTVEATPGAAILRRGAVIAIAALRNYGVVAGFLIFWQISATVGWVNPSIFPPLDKIFGALFDALASGRLTDDIAISLQRSGVAFGFAVIIGIPLGLFMGQIKSVERALDPILQLFRQTSALAIYPGVHSFSRSGRNLKSGRHILGDPISNPFGYHWRRQGSGCQAN